MTKDWCCPLAEGIRLTVQITPNAKKSEVVGVLEGALQAQPIEGKANDALIRYLADALDVPRSAITIVHGHTSKRKIIEIARPALTINRVKQALLPVM